jgi:hypothetical protein
MSRNVALAVVAIGIWAFAYGWYFVGVGRLRATAARLWKATRRRLGLGIGPH